MRRSSTTATQIVGPWARLPTSTSRTGKGLLTSGNARDRPSQECRQQAHLPGCRSRTGTFLTCVAMITNLVRRLVLAACHGTRPADPARLLARGPRRARGAFGRSRAARAACEKPGGRRAPVTSYSTGYHGFIPAAGVVALRALLTGRWR